MKNKMLINFVTILICVLLVLGLYSIITYMNYKDYKETSMWVSGIGTLSKFTHSRSANKVSYNYQGTWYDESSDINISPEGAIIGEKYEIRINPNFPEKYIPLSWKPVFLSDENTDSTTAKVLKIYQFKFSFIQPKDRPSFAIRFRYKVNGIEYERSQDLPPEYSNKNSSIHEGTYLKVEYWCLNPQRSIIYLNNISTASSSVRNE